MQDGAVGVEIDGACLGLAAAGAMPVFVFGGGAGPAASAIKLVRVEAGLCCATARVSTGKVTIKIAPITSPAIRTRPRLTGMQRPHGIIQTLPIQPLREQTGERMMQRKSCTTDHAGAIGPACKAIGMVVSSH